MIKRIDSSRNSQAKRFNKSSRFSFIEDSISTIPLISLGIIGDRIDSMDMVLMNGSTGKVECCIVPPKYVGALND